MRLAFCVFLVVALVALPAPTHAGWPFGAASAAYQRLEKAESLLDRPKRPSFILNSFGFYRLLRPQADKLDELKLPHREPDEAEKLYYSSLEARNKAESVVVSLKGDDFIDWHRSMRELAHQYRVQAEKATEVHSNKPLLKRSPPLDKAVDNLNLGVMYLEQAYGKGRFNPYQRQRVWEILSKYWKEGLEAIDKVQSHIKVLNTVAEIAKARLTEAQKKAATASGQELEVLQVEIGSYDDGVKILNAINEEHQQDIEEVKTTMDVFKVKVELFFGHKLGVNKVLN